jgi:transposase-like protein
MARKPQTQRAQAVSIDSSLARFACPNPDCADFNRFDAGNLSVAELTGKEKEIRRLYCKSCGHRFSERQGTLLKYGKLPEETVVRIIKCLGHGCSVEATADICEVDSRTVQRMLRIAGERAEDFHRLQLEKLPEPPKAVEMDELHGRVVAGPKKKGSPERNQFLAHVAEQVGLGFMRLLRW